MIWRYLKTQASILMYGMIGPFFLILYFASDGGEFMRWFLWSGLAVTAICVVTAVVMTARAEKSAAKRAELEQTGVLALARVVDIQDTGTEIRGQTLVRLALEISGPGIAPFTSEDRVIASMARMPMITGGKLVALVDPTTNEYQIDWERSGLISGLTPAIFTFADEDGTYDLSGKVEPLMEILRILKANGIRLNDTVDWATYPAARQEVRAIVRRATSQHDGPGTVADISAAQRLQQLETLRTTGAITDDEYATKRQEIVSQL
jgi:hypothetical protein